MVGQRVDLTRLVVDPPDGLIAEHKGKIYLSGIDVEGMVYFRLPTAHLYVNWIHEDNYYQYARLEMQSGDIWHGWAGYGVGAGLENCGYGYSTEEREETLLGIWSDAIKDR